MNYGLYLSASGVLTNMYRQDVLANNLANVETVGFKRDLATIRQRAPESVELPAGMELRQDQLDRLGGGVLAGPQRVSFEPGDLKSTGSPLDVALEDSDTFFVVSSSHPSTKGQVRLTRDGRFTRDAQGQLVTAAGGHVVLDAANQPIVVPEGAAVKIDHSGQVVQDNEVLGRLQVARIADTSQLRKQGANLLRYDGPAAGQQAATDARLRPGFVEQSDVDPVITLLQLVEATKAITENGNMIRYHDTLMDRAVNVLGRVVA